MDFNGQSDFSNLNNFDDLFPDRAELEAEELFAQADRLLNEGVIMEAVGKLTQILKRNPRFGKAYNHLGWVYETKYKNTERAEEYYKAAMRYSPNYNASYLNYSYFLSNLGRFEELKEHLDKISNIGGIAKDIVYNEYAIMYEMQSNPQTAIDYYQKAALTTLDIGKFDKYKESIERCRRKLEILSPSTSFLN
ncbi:MAG TPA: tetratricopeptide repeat protein [Pyrinomonadaceae bacterium]|jgi:tetratricopeptide (TPR) repeat protein|nr:tetratricopeptide repeat protein [Pyrinomonadaceae bacterium]